MSTATVEASLRVPDSSGLAVPRREPLVHQAAAIVRGAILDGRWRVGDRLPAEPQLAADLGVSRGTLRDSIRLLISDGLLDRRHGSGTYVLRVPTPTIERGIEELFSLSEGIEALGYEPSTGPWTVDVMPAEGAAAADLRLGAAEPVCRLTRIRLADARPVILCEDKFPARLLEAAAVPVDAVGPEVARRGSLYAWFEDRLGLVIDSALARIEPVVTTAAQAAQLEMAPGSPALRLAQIHFLADGRPVLYSENLHNSDVFHFHVRRQRARRLY